MVCAHDAGGIASREDMAVGKLFLPRETQGTWDAKSRALTVYVGEDAFVGYAGTPHELDTLEFSAWGGSSGECATEVYDEGPGRLSTRITTDRPMTLNFTVTDGSKNLAPPATIYVRMRPDYRHMQPEGQLDETACWAACLAFWLRVLPDRPSVSQQQLLKLGSGMWNYDGTMNPSAIERLVVKQGYRMKCMKIQQSQLIDYMGHWPLLLGFTASGGFAHMNVLVGYSMGSDTVDPMEPMYPDPIFDSDYTVMDSGNKVPLFYNKATGQPFQYTGAVRTGLSRTSFSPMKGGTYWIGFPQEYLMP